MGFSKQLENAMGFYGAYHSNPMNQLIHFIFVPLIWWSSVVFVCYSGPLVAGDVFAPFTSKLNTFAATAATTVPIADDVAAYITRNLVFNGGFVVFVLYASYYLYLGDYFAAATYNVMLFAMYLHANSFIVDFGEMAWKYALGIHILSWIMQVAIGHVIFEGRKPALLDNLWAAIVFAPLFTWLEFLFFFGYKKEFADKLWKDIAKKQKSL